MKFVCKITRSQGQAKITLPKLFLKRRRLEQTTFIIIDDHKDNQAIIRGAGFEEDNDEKRKAGAVKPGR